MMQDDRRRHLEEEVSEEEDPCSESKDLRRKPEVSIHRQSSEADVDAIEKRHKIEKG